MSHWDVMNLHPNNIKKDNKSSDFGLHLLSSVHGMISKHKKTKLHAPHTLIVSEGIWRCMKEKAVSIGLLDRSGSDYFIMGLRVIVDRSSSWRMEVV